MMQHRCRPQSRWMAQYRLGPSRLRSVLCPDSFLNPRAEGYLAMAWTGAIARQYVSQMRQQYWQCYGVIAKMLSNGMIDCPWVRWLCKFFCKCGTSAIKYSPRLGSQGWGLETWLPEYLQTTIPNCLRIPWFPPPMSQTIAYTVRPIFSHSWRMARRASSSESCGSYFLLHACI